MQIALTCRYLAGQVVAARVDSGDLFYRMARSFGWLAQLGEHQPYKLRVTGSIPVPPTKDLER